MADELMIHTEQGTFRVPVEVLEAYRIEEEPEVSGFDFAGFGHFGIVVKPGEDIWITPESGGDEAFSPRLIGETEKNLAAGPRSGARSPRRL